MIRDDGSDGSSDVEDSFCFIDEEIVLGEVDWQLVKNSATYQGDASNEILAFLDPIEDVRIGSRTQNPRVLWMKKPNSHSATIHPVEKVPKKVFFTDPVAADNSKLHLDTSCLLRLLHQETHGNDDVLWTLLKLKYPFLSAHSSNSSPLRDMLASVNPPLPDFQGLSPAPADADPSGATSSWTCTCGKVNTGFKATCEECSAYAPSGWWKQNQDPMEASGTSQLLSATAAPQAGKAAAIPKMARHTVFHVTRNTSRVGWTLRDDDLTILSVEGSSSAADAGILPGMRLVAIDDTHCVNVGDVRSALATAGSVFDVTVSMEPVTNLRAAQSLSGNDGVVMVVLQKQNPTDRMGTFWKNEDDLILQRIEPGTAADVAGLASLVGWRLTHVNSAPVQSSEDIIREAAGESNLALYWVRTTPAVQVFPRMSQQPNAMAAMQQMSLAGGGTPNPLAMMGVHPSMVNNALLQQTNMPSQARTAQPPVVVSVYAPSLLWVMAPERVQHCGGLYRLQQDQINDQPFWKHEVNHLLLYSSSEGLWCISDSSDTGNGWVFSRIPSSASMPDNITEWEVMGETDGEIQVVSQLPIPGLLHVTVSAPKLEHIKGTYTLVRSEDPTCLPFQVVNGMPVWQCAERERWLYSSRKGTWFITDDMQDFVRGGGCISGKTGHGGDMPYKQKMWATRDNTDRPDVRVQLPTSVTHDTDSVANSVEQSEMSEAPKANVTASVHENAVWKYEDVGAFSLASYLQKNSNANNLLWVGAGGKQGWLGIDLSNEDERGHLVKTLTELVDQECITVRQPIVAGVSVRLTQQVTTAEGELLEVGAKGQVVSVVMSRTPVGNTPPRMAKVSIVSSEFMFDLWQCR